MHLSFAILAASLFNSAAAVTITTLETQYRHHIVNVMVDQYGNPYSTQTVESFGSYNAPAPTSGAAQVASPSPATSASGELGDEDYNSLSHSHSADAPTFAYISPASTQVPSFSSSTSSTWSPEPVTSVTSSAPYTPQTNYEPSTSGTSTSTTPSKTTSSAPSNTGGSGDTFSGDATYYDVGLGACGVTNTDSELIAALNVEQFNQFGSMSNGNPVCGKTATLHYQGKSVTVTIQDKCPGCAYGSLDLSPAAFTQLADKSLGRIQITWSFN